LHQKRYHKDLPLLSSKVSETMPLTVFVCIIVSLFGSSAQAYACAKGAGAKCKTCKDQADRTGDNQCETCNAGYGLNPTTSACEAAQYELVTSGTTCPRITSITECSSAAVSLGLADITASDDGYNSVSYDPPYCYFEGNGLKFNTNAGNTGPCTSSDKCLCKTTTQATCSDYPCQNTGWVKKSGVDSLTNPTDAKCCEARWPVTSLPETYSAKECCSGSNCDQSILHGDESFAACAQQCWASASCKGIEFGRSLPTTDSNNRCTSDDLCKCYLVTGSCSDPKTHLGYSIYLKPQVWGSGGRRLSAADAGLTVVV